MATLERSKWPKKSVAEEKINSHLLLTNFQSFKLVIKAKQLLRKKLPPGTIARETVLEMLSKLKHEHFISLPYSSDINQRNFFFVLGVS